MRLEGRGRGCEAPRNRGSHIFNVVYAHLRDEDAQALHRGNVSLIWSRLPLEGSDLYLYLNAYGFTGRQKGLNVLLLHEPAVVLPAQYDETIWNNFDHVVTYYDRIMEGRESFTKALIPRSGIQKFIMDSDITESRQERERRYPLTSRIPGFCMINGNKGSKVTGGFTQREPRRPSGSTSTRRSLSMSSGIRPFLCPTTRGLYQLTLSCVHSRNTDTTCVSRTFITPFFLRVTWTRS